MGDNQSLLDNLSTFSGHIKNLTEIIDSITDKSLVILDELGTGTSPLEGEALGVGVIEHLHELGCFGIFTSHYEGLKNFALEHDYILNASMAFDEENISPTYHLRLGVAGKSYGIALATRMNLNHDVLSKAQVYLDEKVKTDKDITLQALNQKLEENEGIRYELQKAQEEIEKQKHHLDNEIEKYKRLENKIFLDSEKKKDELIKDAKEQIDAIVEEMKQKENFKLHEVIGAKKKLDDLSSKEEDEEEVTITINVGDNVRMIDSDISGKVIKLKGENVTLLTDRGMNLNVKLNQLQHYVPKAKKKQNMFVSGFRTMKSVPLECNIVGEYVEEGIQIVDKYLDDCVSVHYKECRIIHGHGTGKLREAVHKYLDTRKDIKSYRLGGMGEGGVGATVVYFK
jgi:DNA mismatch repair protein MutS2